MPSTRETLRRLGHAPLIHGDICQSEWAAAANLSGGWTPVWKPTQKGHGPTTDYRDFVGIVLGMKASIDSVGRIVVPKPFRDALGLVAGSTVDISRYGAGLQLVPSGRTAQLVEEDGVLVATGTTVIDDEDVFGLIDAGRR